MPNLLPLKGTSAQISGRAISDGQLLIDTESGAMYVDHDTARVQIKDPSKSPVGHTHDYSKVTVSRSLTSGTKVGTISIDGSSTDLYCQTNTDTKVTQNSNTSNINIPLLLAYSNNPTSGTASTVNYNSNIYANPSTGTITATKFNGNADQVDGFHGSDDAFLYYNNKFCTFTTTDDVYVKITLPSDYTYYAKRIKFSIIARYDGVYGTTYIETYGKAKRFYIDSHSYSGNNLLGIYQPTTNTDVYYLKLHGYRATLKGDGTPYSTSGNVSVYCSLPILSVEEITSDNSDYATISSYTYTSVLSNGGISSDAIWGSITSAQNNTYTLGSSSNKWANVYATTFTGSLSGNATSATKLQTARTLTVGDTGKTFDGSSDVSWTLDEMGAAEKTHNHIIDEKTYSGIYASANNFNDGTFYFASVRPTDWYKEWHIKYQITSYVPNQNNYSGYFEVELWGAQNARTIYKCTNAHYNNSFRSLYYHVLYSLTSTGFDNGYGHVVGIGLRNSTGSTLSSRPRTFNIQLLEVNNCEVTMWDEMKIFANIAGTGSTNYNGYSEFDGYSNGLRESGDDNSVDQLAFPSVKLQAGTKGIQQNSLIMQDSEGKWQSFTTSSGKGTTKSKNTEGFILGKILYYYGAAVSNDNLCAAWTVRSSMALDFRYSSNCGTTLSAYKSLYLKGTIGDDGLFYLSDDWYTQTLPTEDDGCVYIYIGETYNATNVHLSPVHPVYWYKNGAIREYGNFGNKITGTKTVTSTGQILVATSLTTADLGFTPTENTSIVVSVREPNEPPSPLYLNVYTTQYQGHIYLCLTKGGDDGGSAQSIPAGTYYIDYIVTNKS